MVRELAGQGVKPALSDNTIGEPPHRTTMQHSKNKLTPIENQHWHQFSAKEIVLCTVCTQRRNTNHAHVSRGLHWQRLKAW